MYELTIILIETEHGIWNLVIKNTDDCASFDLFIEYEVREENSHLKRQLANK